MSQRAGNLRGELVVQPVNQITDVIRHVADMQRLAPPITGIQNFFHILDARNDHLIIRQRQMTQVAAGTAFFVAGHDAAGEVGELLFQAEVGSHGGCSKARP